VGPEATIIALSQGPSSLSDSDICIPGDHFPFYSRPPVVPFPTVRGLRQLFPSSPEAMVHGPDLYPCANCTSVVTELAKYDPFHNNTLRCLLLRTHTRQSSNRPRQAHTHFALLMSGRYKRLGGGINGKEQLSHSSRSKWIAPSIGW